MGFDQDLSDATKMAVREMIDFLVDEKHLSRDDAYMLASVAADISASPSLSMGIRALMLPFAKGIFHAL